MVLKLLILEGIDKKIFIRVLPILYWISFILVEFNQSSMTESFSVSPSHSWLFGVMVTTPD